MDDNTMEGSRSSLERLKSLDTLPDLSSQLEEARRLCTHTARADMIAKWLLDNLRNNRDTRLAPEAWDSLLSTTRLLSPERLAALMTTHKLITTIILALHESPKSEALLLNIAIFMEHLLQRSQGVYGLQINSFLSVAASQAASFLASWLRATCHVLVEMSDHDRNFAFNPTLYIRPAVRIWNLRKRSADDNPLFAEHCFAPAASLLAALPTKPMERLSKRKHFESNDVKETCRDSLESLLAKHIFLPCRTAFSKSQEQATNRSRRNTKTENSAFNLHTALEFIRPKQGEDTDTHLRLSAALPLLLDVALRCVPTPTPKQRIKEQPWFEAVFMALHECNKVEDGGLYNRLSLLEMLEISGSKIALSKTALETLLQDYTKLTSASKSRTDWELIAHIVDLDAEIFLSEPWTSFLFERITTAGASLQAKPGSDTAAVHLDVSVGTSEHHLQVLWKEGIIVPIMQAFARSRKLPMFVKMWSEQLQHDHHNEKWSVWTELDEPLGPLLEASLTESQILELVEQYNDRVRIASNGQISFEPVPVSETGACVVILDAILGAIKGESLKNASHESLRWLLHRLLRMSRDSDSYVLKQRRLWRLMTRTFEIWFPLWAVQHSKETKSLEDTSLHLLDSAVSAALNLSKQIRSSSLQTEIQRQEVSDAECFVASLCCHLHSYPTPGDGLFSRDTTTELVRRLRVDNVLPLIRYPNLLPLASKDARCEFFTDCLSAASGDTEFPFNADSIERVLDAIAAACISKSQTIVLEELVQIVALSLTGEYSFKKERIAIAILSNIPAASLTRSQREQIISVVCNLPVSTDSLVDIATVQHRFALLTNLMKLSNATSALSTDPNTIWKLATGSDMDNCLASRPKSQELFIIQHASTIILLRELTRLTLKHLLATQEQKRSRLVLENFSTDVNDIVNSVSEQRQVGDYRAVFAMINTVIRELEVGSCDELKGRLLHRNSTTMQVYIERLYEIVSLAMKDTLRDGEATALDELVFALNALLDMPDAFLMQTNLDTGALADGLRNAILAVPTKITTDDHIPHRRRASTQYVLARGYRLLSKFVCLRNEAAQEVYMGDLARRLIELQLQPVEHETLLTAFEKYVDQADNAHRINLLKELLLDYEISASTLHLLTILLGKLDGVNLDVDHATLHQVFHALLAAAADSDDFVVRQLATKCLTMILRQKHFLINQHSIDATLVTSLRILQNSTALSISYLDVCKILSTILLQHRYRLHGRFHLVIPVFQKLISCLFTTRSKSRTSPVQERTQLTVKHARALARLLKLFCEPPQLKRHAKSTGLVDESRKEQAYVGQYVQYILHHYCTELLKGAHGDGMREALMPGLWAVIEAIEMNDADGTKSLSAAMNNSERAVLRSVYGDWRRFGKWRGS